MSRRLYIFTIFSALLSGCISFLALFPSITPSDAVPLAETQYENSDKETLYSEAKALHDAGDYQSAIDTYKKVITKDPNDLKAHWEIAHTYRYWYKLDESESWFKKALQLDPENAHTLTEIGKLYRNMARYEEAEEMFLKALEYEQNSSEIYNYGLGYLYLEQGRYEEAETAMLKALEISPEKSFTYMSLGDFYREREMHEESEQMFLKAITIDPKSESYYGLGLLYEDQGRYKDAIKMYLTYIDTIRLKGEVYNALARSYTEEDELELALEAAKMAVHLNPEDISFVNRLNHIEELKSAHDFTPTSN